jgi:hypothetical protein
MRSAFTNAKCSTAASAGLPWGLRGTEKLDAALRFIVQYQQSYSGVRLVDIEPEVVIAQLVMVAPLMRERLQSSADLVQRQCRC